MQELFTSAETLANMYTSLLVTILSLEDPERCEQDLLRRQKSTKTRLQTERESACLKSVVLEAWVVVWIFVTQINLKGLKRLGHDPMYWS